jgi:hypothetical protein
MLSITGPMFAGALFREVLSGTGATLPDLEKLALQHAQTVLDGLIVNKNPLCDNPSGARTSPRTTKAIDPADRTVRQTD